MVGFDEDPGGPPLEAVFVAVVEATVSDRVSAAGLKVSSNAAISRVQVGTEESVARRSVRSGRAHPLRSRIEVAAHPVDGAGIVGLGVL